MTTVPELVEAIRAVYQHCPVGSGLHIVVDDENIETHDILWCIKHAIPEIENEAERAACERCAQLLLVASKSQRKRAIRKYHYEGG